MPRLRTSSRLPALLAAAALLASGCGDDNGTAEQPPDAEAPATTQAASDGASEAAEATTTSTTAAPAGESGAPDDAAPAENGEAADAADAVPADAGALLASATTALDGRSVRGEATIEFAPGFGFSTSFESDAEGDLAATVEIPPGLDPEFPSGADAGMRYVDGVVYLRPPVDAETMAELGVDEAWYVAEPAPAGDPMAQAMGSAGVMCIFPQAMDEAFEDCDPLGETGTFLEAGREAEVVGREDVRGVEATRVRFLVSLMDLAGDALGIGPDEGDAGAEDGAFDDTASDPFAEGVEQIFGFLDADFEVEVWIDDESLIRRLQFDLASLFAGMAGGEVEMPSNLISLEFYDFDADISVDAPPPEAIFDEDLLIGGDDYATSDGY